MHNLYYYKSSLRFLNRDSLVVYGTFCRLVESEETNVFAQHYSGQ